MDFEDSSGPFDGMPTQANAGAVNPADFAQRLVSDQDAFQRARAIAEVTRRPFSFAELFQSQLALAILVFLGVLGACLWFNPPFVQDESGGTSSATNRFLVRHTSLPWALGVSAAAGLMTYWGPALLRAVTKSSEMYRPAAPSV